MGLDRRKLLGALTAALEYGGGAFWIAVPSRGTIGLTMIIVGIIPLFLFVAMAAREVAGRSPRRGWWLALAALMMLPPVLALMVYDRDMARERLQIYLDCTLASPPIAVPPSGRLHALLLTTPRDQQAGSNGFNIISGPPGRPTGLRNDFIYRCTLMQDGHWPLFATVLHAKLDFQSGDSGQPAIRKQWQLIVPRIDPLRGFTFYIEDVGPYAVVVDFANRGTTHENPRAPARPVIVVRAPTLDVILPAERPAQQ